MTFSALLRRRCGGSLGAAAALSIGLRRANSLIVCRSRVLSTARLTPNVPQGHVASQSDQVDAHTRLLDWLCTTGGAQPDLKRCKLAVHQTAERGRCLTAQVEAQPGAVLLSVPLTSAFVDTVSP